MQESTGRGIKSSQSPSAAGHQLQGSYVLLLSEQTRSWLRAPHPPRAWQSGCKEGAAPEKGRGDKPPPFHLPTDLFPCPMLPGGSSSPFVPAAGSLQGELCQEAPGVDVVSAPHGWAPALHR